MFLPVYVFAGSPIAVAAVAPSAHYCSAMINVFSVFAGLYYSGGPARKPPETDINFQINHCFSRKLTRAHIAVYVFNPLLVAILNRSPLVTMHLRKMTNNSEKQYKYLLNSIY